MTVPNLRPIKEEGISGVEVGVDLDLIYLMQDDDNIYAGGCTNRGFFITHTFTKDKYFSLDENLQEVVELLEEEAAS